MSRREDRFKSNLEWCIAKGADNYNSSNVSIFASMVMGNLRKSSKLTPERIGDIYEACQKFIDDNKGK